MGNFKMTADSKSTIVALCYTQKTNLDFQALTVEMAQALQKTVTDKMELQNNYDDVVIFNLPDGQIALAHSDLHMEFPRPWMNCGFAECLFISVSSTSDSSQQTMLFASLAVLLDGIVERIETQLPSNQRFRFERKEVFTEVIYDQLVEQICATTQAAGAWPRDRDRAFQPIPEITGSMKITPSAKLPKTAIAPKTDWARSRGSSVFVQYPPDDTVLEIAARFDAERHRREQACSVNAKAGYKTEVRQPTHPAAAADAQGANALAEASNTPCDEAGRIRLALYPPNEEASNELFENTRAQTTLHRVAVHALNTSVMAFSLPVGAVLLTLSLAGRESMVISSRLTATTGSAIGVMQADYWHSALSFFV
jgi:hypothetical protein